MKKTLSIILSLALLLGAVVVIPAFSVSAETVEFSDYDTTVETLFDSEPFNKNDANDSTNQINTATGKLWLDSGAWIGSSRKDGLFIGSKVCTSPLLEYNAASKTDLTDFEWQFDLCSGNGSSANTANISFVFHVSDDSTVTYSGRYKALAVTLFGANYTASNQQPMSLMAEYALNEGAWRPVSYTYDSETNTVTPNADCYIDMSGFANKSSDAYTSFKNITVNIKLNYNVLTVTVWETANTTNTQSMQITIPEQAFKDYSPSGDFVITSGGSSCNMFFKCMSIKADTDVLYSKGKATSKSYRWWEANTIYAEDTSTGVWNSVSRSAQYIANADAVQLNQNGVADRLLENNGTLPEGGVENFVWGFDFTPGRTWGSRTSFAFHIDDTSVTNGVATTDGDTVTNYLRPLCKQKEYDCRYLLFGEYR